MCSTSFIYDLHLFVLLVEDSSDDEANAESTKAITALAKALEKTQGQTKQKEKKRVNMLSWVMAVNRFAIAAEAVGMWSYSAAQVHIENCAKVAGVFSFSLGMHCM